MLKTGLKFRIYWKIALLLFPKKGGLPVSRMQVITPTAQMSTADPYGSPLMISGAM